jgi:hypothetical protein
MPELERYQLGLSVPDGRVDNVTRESLWRECRQMREISPAKRVFKSAESEAAKEAKEILQQDAEIERPLEHRSYKMCPN